MQLRIKNLQQHTWIKTAIGVLLLCTFLLGITPKQLLHTISANHKDQLTKKDYDKLQYQESGFNCDCNDMVATSAFTEAVLAIETIGQIHFLLHSESASVSLFSADYFYLNLRGPPATA